MNCWIALWVMIKVDWLWLHLPASPPPPNTHTHTHSVCLSLSLSHHWLNCPVRDDWRILNWPDILLRPRFFSSWLTVSAISFPPDWLSSPQCLHVAAGVLCCRPVRNSPQVVLPHPALLLVQPQLRWRRQKRDGHRVQHGRLLQWVVSQSLQCCCVWVGGYFI